MLGCVDLQTLPSDLCDWCLRCRAAWRLGEPGHPGRGKHQDGPTAADVRARMAYLATVVVVDLSVGSRRTPGDRREGETGKEALAARVCNVHTVYAVHMELGRGGS